jgi:hypothetical protein
MATAEVKTAPPPVAPAKPAPKQSDSEYLEERGWRKISGPTVTANGISVMADVWMDMNPGDGKYVVVGQIRDEKTNELKREIRQFHVPGCVGMQFPLETALVMERKRDRAPLPKWETFMSRSSDAAIYGNRWKVRDRQKICRPEEFMTEEEATAFVTTL